MCNLTNSQWGWLTFFMGQSDYHIMGPVGPKPWELASLIERGLIEDKDVDGHWYARITAAGRQAVMNNPKLYSERE